MLPGEGRAGGNTMSTRWVVIHDGPVSTVTMLGNTDRRPPTLDLEDFDRFDALLAELADRAQGNTGAGRLRLLVLKSRSPIAFSAGADIAVLEGINASTIAGWIQRGHQSLERLECFPAPTVAVLEAPALGGGLELALACDHIIAVPDATVGLTEARLGFVPGWGGTRRLSRRVGHSRAMQLIARGEILSAERAQTLGIVDYVGSTTELERWVNDYQSVMAETSGFAVARAKEILVGLGHDQRDQATQLETTASMALFRGGDTTERLSRFLAERQARKSAGKQ